MNLPTTMTQKDAALAAKIPVREGQFCPETKEQLQVLIKYEEIPLDAINTAAITDMSRLFEKATKRKSFAGINTWDTSAVTDMSYMFAGCERFNEELGAEIPATSLVGKLLKRSAKSRFDTSKVTTMAHMFEGCKDFNKPLKLATAACENFASFLRDCVDFNSSVHIDTSAATNLSRMFESCVKFNQALNLDTSKATNMSLMMHHCRSFNQALNWNTQNAELMNGLLAGCTQFDQAFKLNTSKAKKLNYLLAGTHVNGGVEIDCASAENIDFMFQRCTKLAAAPVLKNLDEQKITSARGVFDGCSKLENAPDMSAYGKAGDAAGSASGAKTSSGEKKYHPQDKDELIALINDLSVHLGDIDTSAITDMSSLYDSWDCERTDWSGIGDWDTSNVTEMQKMLEDAKDFNEPLNWDTSKVTCMYNMFAGCKKFNQPLKFDTKNVSDMSEMFKDCEEFDQRIEFDFSSLDDANDMFKDAVKMDVSKVNIDASNISKLIISGLKGLGTKAIELGVIKIVNGKAQPESEEMLKLLCDNYDYKLSDIDTSLITDMSALFRYSERTNWSGISDWDTSNVTNMRNMFNGCEGFNEKLNWDTSKVTDMSSMFFGCKAYEQDINFSFAAITKASRVENMFACAEKINASKIKNLDENNYQYFLKIDGAIALAIQNNWIKKVDGKIKPESLEVLKIICQDDAINLGDIDTSAITDMSMLFMNSTRTNWDGISDWDTSNVTNMYGVFQECLTFNERLNWDTSKVTNFDNMFDGCSEFNQPVNFNTASSEGFAEMFRYCRKFSQPIDFDFSRVVDIRRMFAGCEEFNQPLHFNAPNLQFAFEVLSGCTNFNSPVKMDSNCLEDVSCFFNDCVNFNQPVSFDTSRVWAFDGMFSGCSALTHIPDLDTSSATQMTYMFKGCKNLKGSFELDVSSIDDLESGVTCMLQDCPADVKFNNPEVANYPGLKDYIDED